MDVRVQTRMDMDMDNVRVQLVSPRVQFLESNKVGSTYHLYA